MKKTKRCQNLNSTRSIKLQLFETNLRNLSCKIKAAAFELDTLKALHQQQKFQFETLQRQEWIASNPPNNLKKSKEPKTDLKELKKILGTDANIKIFLNDLLGKHSGKTQPAQVKIYQNPYFSNISKETS